MLHQAVNQACHALERAGIIRRDQSVYPIENVLLSNASAITPPMADKHGNNPGVSKYGNGRLGVSWRKISQDGVETFIPDSEVPKNMNPSRFPKSHGVLADANEIRAWVWENILKPNYTHLPLTLRAGDMHDHLGRVVTN